MNGRGLKALVGTFFSAPRSCCEFLGVVYGACTVYYTAVETRMLYTDCAPLLPAAAAAATQIVITNPDSSQLGKFCQRSLVLIGCHLLQPAADLQIRCKNTLLVGGERITPYYSDGEQCLENVAGGVFH